MHTFWRQGLCYVAQKGTLEYLFFLTQQTGTQQQVL